MKVYTLRMLFGGLLFNKPRAVTTYKIDWKTENSECLVEI